MPAGEPFGVQNPLTSNLDVGSFGIVSSGDADITITPNGSGNSVVASGNLVMGAATVPSIVTAGGIVAYDVAGDGTRASLVHVQIPESVGAYGGFSISYAANLQWLIGISRSAGDIKQLSFFEDGISVNERLSLFPGGSLTVNQGTVPAFAGEGSMAITSSGITELGVVYHAQVRDVVGGFGGFSSGYGAAINWLLGQSKNVTDTTSFSWFEDASGAKVRLQLKTGGGIAIPTDSLGLYFGEAEDAGLWYDGTNAVFNPKLVGSGYLDFRGGLIFNGVGTGLAYASIHAKDSATTITINGTGVANKVQINSFDTDGDSLNVTPDHTNDHITITKAGVYRCSLELTIDSVAGSAAKFVFGLWRNNGATQIPGCNKKRDLPGGAGGNSGSVSLEGYADCEVGDTIEPWCYNASNTQNFTVDDATLLVEQVGGT